MKLRFEKGTFVTISNLLVRSLPSKMNLICVHLNIKGSNCIYHIITSKIYIIIAYFQCNSIVHSHIIYQFNRGKRGLRINEVRTHDIRKLFLVFCRLNRCLTSSKGSGFLIDRHYLISKPPKILIQPKHNIFRNPSINLMLMMKLI